MDKNRGSLYGETPPEVALGCDYLRGRLPMTESSPSEWYASWFDSPHYHRLYGHRSTDEARRFIDGLQAHFQWPASRWLDLACGKGRHAAAAARLGHRVTGMDLSPLSITAAQELYKGQDGLDFTTGDMRHFEHADRFDGVLNLFTSFGYFDRSEDHLAVLRQVRRHLVPGGFLILDFLDVDFALSRLVAEESVERDGTTYHLTRRFGPLPGGTPGFSKDIAFEEEGKRHHFTERVAGLRQSELVDMLSGCGFETRHTFGDYSLNDWVAGESPRVILYAVRS